MKRVKLVVLVVVLISSIFILGAKKTVVLKEDGNTDYEYQQLLRLHVIANSNSLEDQKIKRDIRNEIITKTSKIFIPLEGPKQAKAVVKKNLVPIKKIIKNKLKEYGKDYKVELKLGNFDFPMRTYGNITLKSGKYEALRVVLGEGKGENWWCVLFPPLCFVDSMDKLSEEDLKNLAKNENKLADNKMNIEFKFKFVEVLKENPKFVKSKLKLFNILETSLLDLNKLLFPSKKENN